MADTLAIAWPRTPDGPARCVVVRGGGAVGATCEVPGPVTGDSLKAALARAGIGAKRAVVALPRSLATVRRLDLPAVPDDDLPDLVRMQAATKSAAPLEQLAVDFLPLPAGSAPATGDGPAGRSALLATVPAATLKNVRGAVAGAGLELATVGLSPVGTAALVADRGRGAGGTTLILARDGEFAEVTLLTAGPAGPAVVLTHAAHPHGDDVHSWNRGLLSEATRALGARVAAAQGGIDRAWAVGEGADDLAPMLAERFDCEATAAAGWGELGLAGDAAGDFGPGGLGGAVGLAATADVVPALDFLSPRRRPEAADTRLRTGLLAATAATVLLGGGWWYLNNQKTALADEIALLNAEINADEAFVDRNAPLLAEDAAVAAWTGDAVAAREQLVRLDALMPPTDRLYLKEFRLVPAALNARPTVRMVGNAASDDTVQAFERTLDEAKYLLSPTQINETRIDPECPVEFELSAQIPPDAPPAAAETAAAKTEPGAAA